MFTVVSVYALESRVDINVLENEVMVKQLVCTELIDKWR